MSELIDIFQPRLNEFIPHKPTPTQAAFLWLDDDEGFYGGAGGGGKSEALLMGAAQYVDVPGYAAILFRRSFSDLALPGALMDRAKTWWHGRKGISWNEDTKTFTFPSGARITFAYLERDAQKYRYHSSEYQFIGFDELTTFTEGLYTYLFSRLRKPSTGPLSKVPLRMRAASNPGGIGHDWVKQRFIPDPAKPQAKKPPFIPAKIRDNPYLDLESYRRSLSHMDEVERRRIEDGDWEVLPKGDLFDMNDFVLVEQPPPLIMARARYWDKAATAGGGAYTVGLRMCRLPRNTYWGPKGEEIEYLVDDVVRGQWSIGRRNKIIKEMAEWDGAPTQIWIEQEPGSGGRESAETSVSELAGYDVHIDRVTGDKPSRARAFAAQVEHHRVGVMRAAWTRAYLLEMHSWPNGAYLDQGDTSGGAFNKLALMPAPLEVIEESLANLILNFTGKGYDRDQPDLDFYDLEVQSWR